MSKNIDVFAALLRKEKLEKFYVSVNSKKYLKVRKKLELVIEEIINLLKKYQKEGKIKSIRFPANKRMQNHLKDLVQTKKKLKKSIEDLKLFFD